MTVSVNRRYIPEIDQLRAFAALLVLFYHGLQLIGTQLAQGIAFDPSRHWLYPANPVLTIIEEGHSGVSLFIVLSGFILSLGAVGNSVSYGRFLAARILRITIGGSYIDVSVPERPVASPDSQVASRG